MYIKCDVEFAQNCHQKAPSCRPEQAEMEVLQIGQGGGDCGGFNGWLLRLGVQGRIRRRFHLALALCADLLDAYSLYLHFEVV